MQYTIITQVIVTIHKRTCSRASALTGHMLQVAQPGSLGSIITWARHSGVTQDQHGAGDTAAADQHKEGVADSTKSLDGAGARRAWGATDLSPQADDAVVDTDAAENSAVARVPPADGDAADAHAAVTLSTSDLPNSVGDALSSPTCVDSSEQYMAHNVTADPAKVADAGAALVEATASTESCTLPASPQATISKSRTSASPSPPPRKPFDRPNVRAAHTHEIARWFTVASMMMP
jgi:hypothetical protein